MRRHLTSYTLYPRLVQQSNLPLLYSLLPYRQSFYDVHAILHNTLRVRGQLGTTVGSMSLISEIENTCAAKHLFTS